MGLREDFAGILTPNRPLGPFTLLRVGGSAELYAEPRTREELSGLVRACFAEGVTFRVLGAGSNLLVRDEGVRGLVIRLAAPAFTAISVEGGRVTAGCGADLGDLIAAAARDGLTGFESLAGIPGTVGGAVRCNAGDRSDAIGQWVRRVEVLGADGRAGWRERDEMHFSEHASDLDDPVILSAEFGLEPDAREAIVRRLRRAWVQRNARQPYPHQAACRLFRNPRGLQAAQLIEQAGLGKQTRVGGFELSDRNANYLVAQEGATSRDALQLIELVQAKVRDQCGVLLDRELLVW